MFYLKSEPVCTITENTSGSYNLKEHFLKACTY